MLPIHQAQDDQPLMMLQTTWAQQLNPLLSNPLSNGQLLKSVTLASGTNVINHKLGRKLQGWVLTRVRAAVQLHDTQDSNPRPELTLQLVSSGAVTVDLYVF